MPPSDADLLSDWLQHQNERAFHELVGRYSGLAHSAAKRTCGDEALAAEATQLAFILLARKAGSLSSRRSLAGWLHLTAVMQAKNLLRKRRREGRKHQLFHLDMETHTPGDSESRWKELGPVLDDALASLPEKDREALLLHFYRAMPIREIAGTLDIATDAARKRIERATEKLRGKLARRGIPIGGSLSAVLLVGFTSDAQAGLPPSLIASKASAAAAASPVSILTNTTLMKASAFVPPLAALVVAGFWIIPKREAVASLERRYHAVVDVTPAAAGIRTGGRSAERGAQQVNVARSGGMRIDWEALGLERQDDAKSRRAVNFYGNSRMLLDRWLKAMSAEDLLAEMENIASVGLSPELRREFEFKISFALAEKDPLFALRKLEDYLARGVMVGDALGRALTLYGKDHPAEAEAWVDRQIAAGRLQVKRLDGHNEERNLFEGVLARNGFATDPARAAQRLAGLDSVTRAAALLWCSTSLGPDAQIAYAVIARDMVPEKDRLRVVAAAAWVPFANYKKVDAYLERIAATPEERAASYEVAARSSISTTSINRKLTTPELDKTWNWLGERMPDSRSRIFGEAIGNAVDGTRMEFGAASELVRHYQESSGDDAVLAAFLRSRAGMEKRTQAREMALFIGDEGLRAEVMQHLKP